MRSVLLFLVASAVWILLTDQIVSRFAQGDDQLLTTLQTAKGLTYVAGCTVMFAWFQYRATSSLREAARRDAELAAVVSSSGDAIVSTDPDGTIRTWNAAAERLYGRSAAEAIGRPAEIMVSDEFHADLRQVLGRLRDGSVVETLRARHVRKDGSLVHVVVSAAPIRDAAGRVTGQCSVVRDVTERRRANEAIRASEERYRLIVESSLAGVVWWDADGRMSEANEAFLRMLGCTAEDLAAGRARWTDLTPPEWRPQAEMHLATILEKGTVPPFRMEVFRMDGSRVPVLVSAMLQRSSSRRGVAFVNDLSQQQEMESALRLASDRAAAAQRMEAVGRVAGGIAHDFNNLLTVVIGYAELAAARTPQDDPRWKALDQIRAAGARAAELTQSLLAFSRRQVLEPVVLDVNVVLGEIRDMIERVMGDDVTVELRLDPALPRVRADRACLEQACLNLVLNARDAMPRGGRLTISTRTVRTDAGTHGAEDPPAGTYVEVSVADTGVGMSEDVQKRVFEPFFSTKPHGEGTGLGLATVYGTVRQSGGLVMFDSEAGRGTTFRIHLPAMTGATEEAPAAPPRTESFGHAAATVLVVEDSDEVRGLAVRVLEDGGFRVLSAPNGPKALEAARTHDGTIDAVVTDLVMPGMTGREVAEKLRAERRHIGVLYVSGYTEDEIVLRGLAPGAGRFLKKPYRTEVFVATVRDVVDAARGAAAQAS